MDVTIFYVSFLRCVLGSVGASADRVLFSHLAALQPSRASQGGNSFISRLYYDTLCIQDSNLSVSGIACRGGDDRPPLK